MAERAFWRIVRTNPPTRQDFLSHVDLGRPLRQLDDESQRQAEGISVFATEAQARRKARRVPALGRWLAELRITADAPVTAERTRGGAGHHTLWGDPDTLFDCVKQVVDV